MSQVVPGRSWERPETWQGRPGTYPGHLKDALKTSWEVPGCPGHNLFYTPIFYIAHFVFLIPFMCLSRYLAKIVQGWGVHPDKIDVIPNAVECLPPEDLRPEVDLVTVARLVPWKGLLELIDLATIQNWSLSIVGDGPMREELALKIRASGSNKIQLRGAVTQKQVPRELRRGRVFVLNSSYEGLPHIVLEAKSAGLPVVATDAGGTIETINDRKNGRLLPVGNIKQLGLVLEELLGNERERIKLRSAGYSQIENEFSLKQMAAETERLITQNIR